MLGFACDNDNDKEEERREHGAKSDRHTRAPRRNRYIYTHRGRQKKTVNKNFIAQVRRGVEVRERESARLFVFFFFFERKGDIFLLGEKCIALSARS